MSRFRKITLALLLVAIGCASFAQQRTLQERLGYPKDTKLLIIHADDIGSSHSENVASVYAMEKGVVTSGSIMVPCPWLPEIAEYARTHPDADLGLHLTLTSEWKNYRWGPVAPSDKVPSLLDDDGYFYNSTLTVMKKAKPEEVEREYRAQIERALKMGIKPTHFDTHMAAASSTPEILKVYIKLSHEYKVPVLISEELGNLFKFKVTDYTTANDIVIARSVMANYEDYKLGMEAFYNEQIKAMKPGLNVILLHAAHNDAEEKAVTEGHNDYGANWRQDDFEFYTSDKCRKLLADEKIKLITWKEIRDKLFRQ